EAAVALADVSDAPPPQAASNAEEQTATRTVVIEKEVAKRDMGRPD
ncbi:MAG: hypothetical protein JWQ11_958, partial [Rhizobacter sp.]|nr:hypothetical protein [Rhizobacter sp.]